MTIPPACASDPGAGGASEDTPGGVSIDRLLAELPPAVAALGAGARWEMVAVSATGSTTWRLDRPGSPPTALEVAPDAGGAAARLQDAAARLCWLGARLDAGGRPLSVPSVLASVTDPATGEHFLATSGITGSPVLASELLADADALVAAVAAGLGALHGVPAAPGRFDLTIDDLVSRAAERVRDGLVDPAGFDPIHTRHSPEQLLAHLRAMQPDDPADMVVVHGSPTLDDTVVADGRVVGYTGIHLAGRADRYRDLAVVARQLANRVSPHALGPFFAAYGLDAPDLHRIDFHLLLDELL